MKPLHGSRASSPGDELVGCPCRINTRAPDGSSSSWCYLFCGVGIARLTALSVGAGSLDWQRGVAIGTGRVIGGRRREASPGGPSGHRVRPSRVAPYWLTVCVRSGGLYRSAQMALQSARADYA